ncbi:MAG TPA: hypothetical protein VIT21_11140 [Chthoniobacterales bacterium]
MKTRYLFAAILAFTATAQAEVFVGDTTGGPLWNRPDEGAPPIQLSLAGTAVPYSAQPFVVSENGEYTFHSLATAPLNWDNYTFLYQITFDASQPLTNVLIGNDDENDTVGVSSFQLVLSTGVQYFFVTTGFENSDSGGFANSITGPGKVTFIPEPSAATLMLGSLAIGGVILATRRRRLSTAVTL